MIQDQLAEIIKRFKENDYFQQSANKENDYRHQAVTKDQSGSKQQGVKLRRKVKRLEDTIEKMAIDGNKMHRFYEEIILESSLQFQLFKEEFNGLRTSSAEEKKEGDNLLEYLNTKIEALNLEIANKEELYRDILEKYEYLEEKANEVHLEESEHVKNIEKQFVKESMHHEEERKLTTQEFEEMKRQLSDTLDANEKLLNENAYLKNMNESLAHNIEYLKNRLYAENNIIHEERQEEDHHQFIELERCDVESIGREDDRYTLEEIKMNESHELNFNGEKEVLNLSEHYSKFNRTVEFLSKEKSSYEYVMTESNERKSFGKKREGVSYKQNVLVRIGTMSSKKEEEAVKKTTSRLVTEVKQFKMQEPVTFQSAVVDPYRAFFVLLTQCQKMNSPHFEKISHIDLTYLYDELLRRYVPYNLWQEEIKKVLAAKTSKK